MSEIKEKLYKIEENHNDDDYETVWEGIGVNGL